MAVSLQQDLNAYLSSTWGARLLMLIYSGNGVSVYRCLSGDQSPFICKVLAEVRDSHQDLEKEASMLDLLKHPGIITQYGHFWLQSNEENFQVIMLEYCEKDLYKDMEMRRKAQVYWSEEEMWAHTRTLVGALVFAQSQGVAHRDIKPQNIFFTSDGQIKIGDWGSSKSIQDIENTLTGTPVFLSPLQKQALHSHTASLQHDVFKSDVYSLGLTLLVMALTEVPVTLMTMQEMPENCVDRLPYSDNFKAILKTMVAWEERERCDFVTLWSWLSPVIEHVQPENNPLSAEYGYEAAEPSLSERHVDVAENPVPILSASPNKPVSESKAVPAEEQKQVYTQPTTCLWQKCGKEIREYKKGVVQLYCDAQHAFCSHTCYSKYQDFSRDKLKVTPPKCPKCQTEFSPLIKELVYKTTLCSGNGCPLQ